MQQHGRGGRRGQRPGQRPFRGREDRFPDRGREDRFPDRGREDRFPDRGREERFSDERPAYDEPRGHRPQGRGWQVSSDRPRSADDAEQGLSVRLDPPLRRELQRRAEALGIRPVLLARRWIEERLREEPRSGEAASGDGAMAAVAARLDELTARIADLEAQRGAPEPPPPPAEPEPPTVVEPRPEPEAPMQAADAAPAPEEAQSRRRRGRPPAETPRRRGRPAAARGARAAAGRGGRSRGAPLHDEIEAVLRDAGSPLSTREIAEAVRSRGLYHRRDEGELSVTEVSSRIAHPHYRARFLRVDGKVTMADAAAESDGTGPPGATPTA